MERHEQLQKEYMQALEEILRQLKEKETTCRRDGDQEGVVEAKVQGNVVDIFQKMFTVSLNNTYVKRQIPDFAKFEDAYPDKDRRLFAVYMSYFDKIPAPWREKAEKDQKFGKMADYQTELLKLRIVDEVKSIFIAQYNRIFGEG